MSQAIGKPVPQESFVIRESYLQAAEFVGRQSEMAQLQAAMAAAQAGRGSSWLIGGESGVGKSRLLSELRIQALVEGAIVLRGQSVDSRGHLPYQLWRDVVRRLILTTRLTPLARGVLQTIVPDIAELLEQSVSPPPLLQGKLVNSA